MKANVFISYARKDEPFAKRILQMLEQHGVSAWTDAGIMPGENWDKRLRDVLDKTNCMIVLISKDLIQAQFALFEVGAAMGMKKKIIPISVNGKVEELPTLLRFKSIHDGQSLSDQKLLNIIEQEMLGMAA